MEHVSNESLWVNYSPIVDRATGTVLLFQQVCTQTDHIHGKYCTVQYRLVTTRKPTITTDVVTTATGDLTFGVDVPEINGPTSYGREWLQQFVDDPYGLMLSTYKRQYS